MNPNKLFWYKSSISHPLFGNVAHMDHLWRVIQEAAQASQPHQILFVFQLKADRVFRRLRQKQLLPELSPL